jgi:hypothetical protein
MNIDVGCFYFVSDDFFKIVNDSFLKQNYESTKRPHYFALKDKKTSLLWLIPCSSKTEKFKKIIADREKYGKPNDTIKIVKVQDKKTALLLQDMFPIDEKYISDQYIRGGQALRIANPTTVAEIERSAKKVEILLRKGVKFTPTQPDVLKIEKIMLDGLNS